MWGITVTVFRVPRIQFSLLLVFARIQVGPLEISRSWATANRGAKSIWYFGVPDPKPIVEASVVLVWSVPISSEGNDRVDQWGGKRIIGGRF